MESIERAKVNLDKAQEIAAGLFQEIAEAIRSGK